jgi:hypothetical protein
MAEDTDAIPELSGEIKVKLRKPLKLGKEEIDELTLKPNTAMFRDFELTVNADGTVVFKPYPYAMVGLSLAGYPAAASNLVKQLDPRDMMALAQEVFSFLGG